MSTRRERAAFGMGLLVGSAVVGAFAAIGLAWRSAARAPDPEDLAPAPHAPAAHAASSPRGTAGVTPRGPEATAPPHAVPGTLLPGQSDPILEPDPAAPAAAVTPVGPDAPIADDREIESLLQELDAASDPRVRVARLNEIMQGIAGRRLSPALAGRLRGRLDPRTASPSDVGLVVAVASEASPETTVWLWGVASTAADPVILAMAIHLLPARDPGALPRLREWLRHHESLEVRRAAAAALQNAGWSEESAVVFRDLARHQEKEEAELGMLGLRATDAGDRAVFCELTRHPVVTVRGHALAALQSFVAADPRARDAVLDRLRNDPDRAVRSLAAFVGGARLRETVTADPMLLAGLREAAARDGDAEVRFHASEAVRAHDRRR